MRWALTLLCCALTATAVASAPDTASLLERAAVLYADQEYEAALGLLDEAARRPGNRREQLLELYPLRGLCLGTLGRYEESRAAFARALALDPGLRLQADVSPRVRQPFDELVQAGPRPLLVELDPPMAVISGEPLRIPYRVIHNPDGWARYLRVFVVRGAGSQVASSQRELGATTAGEVLLPADLWSGQGPEQEQVLRWYAVVEDAQQARLLSVGEASAPRTLVVRRPAMASTAPISAELAEEPGLNDDPEPGGEAVIWPWLIAAGAGAGLVAVGALTAVVIANQSGADAPIVFGVDVGTASQAR